MTPGPADEARRALREARERGEQDTGKRRGEGPGRGSNADQELTPEGAARQEQGAAGSLEPEQVTDRTPGQDQVSGVPGVPGVPGGGEARPGDVARAALRRASSVLPTVAPEARGSEPGPGVGSRGGEDDTAGMRPADADPADADPADARPADVAREALRAARAESRQARVDDERAAAGAGRRPRRPAAERTQGGAPRRAGGVQARDMRELLADAFRMPSSAAGPEEPYDDNETVRKGSSEPRTSTSGEGPQTAGLIEPLTEPHADAHRPGTARSAPASAAAPLGIDSPAGHAALRPHSMAAPARDGELRRTFPAFPFPSRASGDSLAPADARFAETWWGNAWVTALEEGALDAKRLARGRSYAEQGHVDAITVTPGLVLAYVQGSRPRPYRVQVRLGTLDDAEWARFLDAAAEQPGHIAALLDKELPQSLADCGVPLLPGPRDLDPHCSCPDRGHPCKHAAALCYQTARLLDADPFVLLLLRGRGERELLDALSRLSAARAARTAQEQEPAPLPGVRASEALAPRRLPPLPAPLPVPPHPEQPPVYPAAPGGPDPFALDQLATDAAARAHALLSTGRDPVAELTLWQDAVRLAAARPGSGLTAGTRALYASLASAAGRTPAELARAVAAWRQGGLEGLAVLEEPWDPPAGRFDRARPLLLAADLPAFRPWRNHLTHPRGHVQLRLGREGLWYAYESEPGHDDWWPRGFPDLDPVGALTGLGVSSEG